MTEQYGNKHGKISIGLVSLAILLMSCICGGGSPQTNTPTPPSADTSYKVTVARNDTIYMYGDSFTAGNNASPIDSCYANRLSSYLTNFLVNRGVGGSYVSAAWASLLSDKNSGKNETVSFMSGVNDYRGANHQHPILTLSYIGYLKSAITLQFLKTRIPATSNLVTLSGTWDSASTNIDGSVYSKYLTSSTSNSTASYTFTDSTVVIGTSGSNGYAIVSGHFDVSIDGTYKGRYFFGAYGTGGYTPQTLIFRGLTNASHTIVITKVGTNKVTFDYFGHLKDVSECKPILIGELPNWNRADYTGYLGTNFYSYINYQVCTIRGDYYGYPVAVVPVNSYLNPQTDIDTDNIHPTNQGHRHIFEAFKSMIN